MTGEKLDPDFMAVSRLLEEIEALRQTFVQSPQGSLDGELAAYNAGLAMAWPTLRDTLRSLLSSRESVTMQLAAIMTASSQNTRGTVENRIDRDHPYWTQAYSDVCAAIDREIHEREAKESAERRIEEQQARIDALMLEYCPDEMTEEQRAKWASSQRPADVLDIPAFLRKYKD